MIYADGMHGRFRLGYGAQFIHVATAMAKDRAEIDALVAHGADPNVPDVGGCTPLHYAAYNNPIGKVAVALFEFRTRICRRCPVRALQSTSCSITPYGSEVTPVSLQSTAASAICPRNSL